LPGELAMPWMTRLYRWYDDFIIGIPRHLFSVSFAEKMLPSRKRIFLGSGFCNLILLNQIEYVRIFCERQQTFGHILWQKP
jgi:hypothetical protein